MAVELNLTDPEYTAPPSHGAVERFFLRFIRDPRDLPFVWLSLAMTFVQLPLAGAMFVPGVFRWWMAPIYWAVFYGFFADRYILMLHCTSHRPLWKREYGFLKFYIPWVLGPFAGETPETYFIHHITMHHAEGNLVKDLSSTMKYRRDSVLDFARYWGDFFFFSIFKLAYYQLAKKRPRLAAWMIFGELSFYVVLAIGLRYAPGAAITVFLAPFLVCRFVMMAGNWGQHAFVDQNDPGNSYKSAITCVNHRYNQRCFNDGYHISHHLSATRHWTEHPDELRQNADKYAANDAVVFKDIDFLGVWMLLMVRNYAKLADHFVELRETPRTKDQIVAFLKSRTEPLDVSRPDVIAAVPA